MGKILVVEIPPQNGPTVIFLTLDTKNQILITAKALTDNNFRKELSLV